MGPQLIFGLLSVGIQPAEQFPGWIQPIVRNQPISQFVYALRALAGDTTDAAPSVTLVGDGADVPVVARLAGDPGADVSRGSGEAVVMPVARRKRTPARAVGPHGRVPEPTPVLGEFASRAGSADAPPDEATTYPVEPRPDDGHRDARCADPLAGHAEYGAGPPDLDDYRAQRAVRQCSDGRRRRNDLPDRRSARSRLMRERADGLLARLWVLPVHRASGLLSRLRRRGCSDPRHHRGDPVCRTGTGFPVPTGLCLRRWRG